MTIDSSLDRGRSALRFAPLAGVLFAGLSAAGDLVIGPFPDGSTPAADLPGYYAAHGDHVSLGGTLAGWGGVFFAVFAAAVWARLRVVEVPAVVSGVVLLGAAIATTADLYSGSVYQLLGGIGRDPQVNSAALQAWHISGAEFGWSGGATLFLLGVAVAAIGYRAMPRWLGWTALVLGLAAFSPWGFIASLVTLLWVAVAGAALTLRPALGVRRPEAVPSSVG